jgi:hypothetical protein
MVCCTAPFFISEHNVFVSLPNPRIPSFTSESLVSIRERKKKQLKMVLSECVWNVLEKSFGVVQLAVETQTQHANQPHGLVIFISIGLLPPQG